LRASQFRLRATVAALRARRIRLRATAGCLRASHLGSRSTVSRLRASRVRLRDRWLLTPYPPPTAVGPVPPATGALSYSGVRTCPAARRASARWNAQAGRDAPANFHMDQGDT